eukprot:CAMPEP_0119405698 /NCGR_PEP_ID=MMETSP1335-20130426/306_1 /TAXON_ID=259385 /ORGANISM="Chrysoculter rhomboideus, Strain RCC1486" /LENGTH=88 /DNA_ID=CAMNT_0007429733 /DNA_START=219 /DNA_END=484 /DNA_ORIENTATION=-
MSARSPTSKATPPVSSSVTIVRMLAPLTVESKLLLRVRVPSVAGASGAHVAARGLQRVGRRPRRHPMSARGPTSKATQPMRTALRAVA